MIIPGLNGKIAIKKPDGEDVNLEVSDMNTWTINIEDEFVVADFAPVMIQATTYMHVDDIQKAKDSLAAGASIEIRLV